MAGAACFPVCVVPLSDPVLLPNNSTADTIKHWVLPTRVQVKKLLSVSYFLLFIFIFMSYYFDFVYILLALQAKY